MVFKRQQNSSKNLYQKFRQISGSLMLFHEDLKNRRKTNKMSRWKSLIKNQGRNG